MVIFRNRRRLSLTKRTDDHTNYGTSAEQNGEFCICKHERKSYKRASFTLLFYTLPFVFALPGASLVQLSYARPEVLTEFFMRIYIFCDKTLCCRVISDVSTARIAFIFNGQKVPFLECIDHRRLRNCVSPNRRQSLTQCHSVIAQNT